MAIKEYIELSKIVNIENGITKLPKNYKINGKYEFLDYKSVYKRESVNDNFEFQKINIFNKNLNMYNNNYRNLIFTWSSETNNDIFYGTYINTHKKFIVNGFCKILKVIDTSYSPKWLCWYINYSKNVQAVRESILYTTRCNMKKKYLDDIKIPKINIFAQQQIIDIIEPKEKLFLKYHNIVDISNIDNFKKTWSILIDIIEPFEKILNNFKNINNNLQFLLKNIYLLSDSNIYFEINKYLKCVKNKMNNDYNHILDLASIEPNNIWVYNYKKNNNFKTNIFSINKGQLFFSTIRPSLMKYGIAYKNSNILGTLLVLDGPKEYLYSLLCLFLQSDFINKCVKNTQGTKMPVLNKKWFIRNKVKLLSQFEIKIIFKIIDFSILTSQKIEITKCIIEKLIKVYIN